jgi:hypothetical protein
MMRTYRNEKHGFELHIPEKWSCPEYRQGDKSVVFDCGIRETFNIQISPLEKEESLDEVEQKFREYAKKQGFINLQISRITVQNKEHLMARYYMLRGIWYKKYLIVFNHIEYQLTAACYDQLTFQESENKWDAPLRVPFIFYSHFKTKTTTHSNWIVIRNFISSSPGHLQ